jgi:hypothetical protein
MAKVPRAKKRKKVLPPRPVKRRDVLKFTAHCIDLRACWWHYRTLFEASVLRRELLETVAPKFFYDLNIMLIEHLILQICKLTDEEGTAKRRNLTTDFLANNADFSKTPGDLKRLRQLTRQMERFRKRLLPTRNKAMAISIYARLTVASLSAARRLPRGSSFGLIYRSSCRSCTSAMLILKLRSI